MNTMTPTKEMRSARNWTIYNLAAAALNLYFGFAVGHALNWFTAGLCIGLAAFQLHVWLTAHAREERDDLRRLLDAYKAGDDR